MPIIFSLTCHLTRTVELSQIYRRSVIIKKLDLKIILLISSVSSMDERVCLRRINDDKIKSSDNEMEYWWKMIYTGYSK